MNIFSESNPSLRLVWDATTLAAFMLDPLTYYWKYVQGYRSREPSVDLLWGTAWDRSMAYYHNLRGRYDRKRALEESIAFTIEHARKVDLDAVAAESKYKARKKNLATLIRSLVWYDDEHGDYDIYEPHFAQPTQVRLPLPMTTLDGEQYWMVANYDQIVQDRIDGQLWVGERKSTTDTIGAKYWEQFDPCVQTSVYDWACSQSTAEPIVGVLMEAVQTAVGFSRFAHHEIRRTPQQRALWEKTMCYWIRQAEYITRDDCWEVAANVAGQRWESATRRIQRRSPAVWEGLLKSEMIKREPWNPLEVQ